SVKVLTTRLRDDIDDAALRLAVLGFEAAGLDLYFFHERSVDACAECAVGARVDAQSTEGRVGDVDSVGGVEVVERRAARDGRVVEASSETIADASGKIKEAADTALHGQVFEKLIV